MVLRFWFDLAIKQPENYSLPPVVPERASSLIKQLRRVYFETGAAAKHSFATINAEWANFILFMERAGREGLFPALNWKSSAHAALPMHKVRYTRLSAQTLNEPRFAPKSMDFEADVYNGMLLEPISLSLSDDEYLVEYRGGFGTSYIAVL